MSEPLKGMEKGDHEFDSTFSLKYPTVADGADSTAMSKPRDKIIRAKNKYFFIIYPPYYVK